MVNIHISGSPGTGKTTLGLRLKKLFPKYKIVETDLFEYDLMFLLQYHLYSFLNSHTY